MNKFQKFGLVFMLFCLIFSVATANTVKIEAAQIHHWKLYTEAKQLFDQGKYKEAIPIIKLALEQQKEVTGYFRLLAESYEKTNQYQLAAQTYYAEAELQYKLAQKTGDYNTYFAVINKAEKLNSELELYIQDQFEPNSSVQLQKFEPEFGAYFGAYIEHDSNLEGLKAQRYSSFNKMTGKQHAIYFTYHKYGNPFPTTFANNVKEAGGAIQLALEPSGGLDAVKNDEYLIQFAKDAAASGVPIFLRYASEMNGSWVKWHGDPKKYIEKFKLVHDVMEKYAPNVAMVFSPSSDPKQNIDEYYPGDAYVDWVGLSMYSVKFFNGDANQPADDVNPLDLLDYVYELYADRKPIMISEYGATHYSKAGNTDTTNFAITKMNMLYNGIKVKYPRVKAVHWFSLNTLVDAHSAERKLNNFSLTENKKVLEAYSQMISDSYFLSEVQEQKGSNQGIYTYSNQTIREDVTAILWAKTYDPYIQKVVVSLDGAQVAELKQYPFQFKLQASKLSAGAHKLKAVVYDSKGNIAITKEFNIKTGKAVEKVAEGQIKLFINEKFVYTSEGKIELAVAPYIANDTTLVPLRFVSTMLGATVNWEGAAKKITIKGNKELVLHVGKKEVTVNGTVQTLSVAPQTINGTTFVPLRFVNEQLGGKVSYSKEQQSIDIFAQ